MVYILQSRCAVLKPYSVYLKYLRAMRRYFKFGDLIFNG